MNTIKWKKYKRVLDILARMWLALIVLGVHVGVSYMLWYSVGFALWGWTAIVAVVAITIWAYNWIEESQWYEELEDLREDLNERAEKKRWEEKVWFQLSEK